MDTVVDVAQGGNITPESVAINLFINTVSNSASNKVTGSKAKVDTNKPSAGDVPVSKPRKEITPVQELALPGPDGTAYKASDPDLALTYTERYTNIASPDRTKHILYGDKTGGGHLHPGQPGKSTFPNSWGADQVMQNVSDVVTDPKLKWESGRVVRGTQSYEVTRIRDGVEIFVV